MGSEGMTSKVLLRFAAMLLIYMCVVDSQKLPDISDFTIEFDNTDTQLDHIRPKRDVSTDQSIYILVVEVNVSEAVFIKDIKTSLESISLPLQVDNTTEIGALNITTVCYPHNTTYQCLCEDQYVWTYNNCIAYNACGEITLGTCNCISAIPTNGEMCVPRNEIPFFDFLIEIQVNASSDVMDEVKALLRGITYPLILDSTTEVVEVDITTVCLQNNTGYQCRCEDQYFWSCDQCSVYQHCDDIINGTCGCISAIPNDGQFCQPMKELTNNATCPTPPTTVPTTTITRPTSSSQMTTTTRIPPVLMEYIIEVEIDMVDGSAINDLKNRLKTDSFPFTTSNMVVITGINFTTVCRQNNTGYQCRCEDQYFWSCDQCSVYQHCDDIINGTCGCISAIPNDGQFCQPMKELTNNLTCPTPSPTAITTPTTPPSTQTTTITPTTPTTTSTTTTPTTTTPTTTTPTTTTPTTTTATTTTPTTTTPTTTTPTTTTPTTTTATTTTPTTTTPTTTTPTTTTPTTTTPTTTTPTTTTTTTTTTTPTTTTTTTTTTTPTTTTTTTTTTTPITTTSTTTPGAYNIPLSLTINEPFDVDLTIQTSQKYRKYKSDFETSIDAAYRNVPSYQPDSARVTNFSPGSVIVGYTITTTNATPDFNSANNQLVTDLNNKGFSVNQNAVIQIVSDGIHADNTTVYPGTSLLFTCSIQLNNGVKIDWMKDGIVLQNTSTHVISTAEHKLTVINMNSADSGQYSCNMTENSIIYKALITITVLPHPNLQGSNNKDVKCEDSTVTLECCADTSYTVKWAMSTTACAQLTTDSGCSTCDYIIKKQDCQNSDKVQQITCEAIGSDSKVYENKTIRINETNKAFDCFDRYFGVGNFGQIKVGDCVDGMAGDRTAKCNSSRLWDTRNNTDNCILRAIQDLIIKAQDLDIQDIPQISSELNNVTTTNSSIITHSPVNVVGIVNVLQQISFVSQTAVISESIMTNFLQTLDVLASPEATTTWTTLNTNSTTQNTSSVLLKSIEDIGQKLPNKTFGIVTTTTYLNRTNISAPYFEPFGINSTTLINIPDIHKPAFFTFIVFSTLNTVLPVRTATNNGSSQTGTRINGDVVAVKAETTINNISFSFSPINTSLGNAQCVFWNYDLLRGIGGWDSTGCELKPLPNYTERFTCECNHTTSFSILMSPYTIDNIALAYITYIGVGISMASLVLCLIIETIIWKAMTRNDTSYMRHVSIVNIALSLLIADICFIIGASIVKPGQNTPVGPCSAVTFFAHFFYLVLFFWMLLSALLLLYRTVMVFSGMSRTRMLLIAFAVGYGAPLLIAVITVASTAGNRGYVQQMNSCWLNWDQTKALLAFVIPALTIVLINLLVLIVVLYKMLRRGVGATTQPDEKHALVVIARCVGILTPLFGLTWGFGIGTMVSDKLGIHVVFAILNSLQGFFILVFGTLLDSKIREALAGRLSLANFSSNRTRSTSAGPSSSSGLPFIQRMRRRNGYNIAEGSGIAAASSSNSETFTNI